MSITSTIGNAIDSAAPLIDRAALAVSPAWGASRARGRMAIRAMSENGLVIPGSRKKSMKGMTARANSPDADITGKLTGTRALSRDLFMNSPLAVSILRRHKMLSIGSGLQVQSVIDREFLKLTPEQAEKYENTFEREFDLWSESYSSDFDGINFLGDNMALGYLNLLMSGDFFFMPVWRPSPEQGFPYELCIKMIDADLVRNPSSTPEGSYGATNGLDIKGGVEKNKRGQVVAYHVWDTYPNEGYTGKGLGKSKRVPVYDANGRQQIYHVYDPERISQRRGIPLLANVADSLKQSTRLMDAALMDALVRNFFTVFVKDMSGMGGLMAPAMTPEETVTGSGGAGPESAPTEAQNDEDAYDLEMGSGNITYLDDMKEITTAEPAKTDSNFEQFWKANAIQICAAGNIPVEQALMHYESSYTAAKAAANDVWKYRGMARTMMARRFCQPIYLEWQQEAALRGRVQAPGLFDDYAYRRAWGRSVWVGSGQGSLDPLRESKAAVLRLNSFLTTHEDEYLATHGGRWDAAMDKRAREKTKLEGLKLEDKPDREELVGPDGQQNEDEEDNKEGGADEGQ